MYAVIETGGKQYRVELGSEFAVERLEGSAGDTIKFDRVLLVADGDNASVGTPVVDDALVTASLVRQDRGDKVIVFKYRPKARHRAKNGHRQELTIVRIADITLGGRSAASEAEVEQKEASKAKAKAAADAEQKATADQALAAKLARDAKAKAAEAKAAADTAEKATEAKSKPAAKKAAPKAEPGSKSSAAGKPAAKKSTSAKSDAGTAKKAKKDE
ncbi:MAG TPA: 50S ribosomal protein L21 [Candidatus Limnocylindria bacterium]|nr:50S ribosomal protein L21 [Candidatus Limnocylindria bacterium]